METKAIYYGRVELISDIYCDAYITEDNQAVMTKRSLSDLLGIDHKALELTGSKWPPKNLKAFFNMDISTGTKTVLVTASNSPYNGREIMVCTTEMVENMIFSYATAFAHGKLRPKQEHIGKRCVLLLKALVRTALDAAIKEACGVSAEVQETVQRHYSAIDLIREAGFISSLNDDLAIKKDIVEFLRVPDATLNTFLRKHRDEIKPVMLDVETIRSVGSKANRMHAYSMEDVAKVVFGMDTDVSLELKRSMFGDVATLAKPNTKDEIAWREFLSEVFAGFNLEFNAPLGRYRIDFLVPELYLALECNGYEHKYYNPIEEARRERVITRKYKLIRFHHQVKLPVLFNAILKAKIGETIVLYNREHIN